MEYHSKWNVTQNRKSLKMKCYPNKKSLKFEFHLSLNVTQIEMSPKLELHSNKNVNQIGTLFKLACHSNMNVTQI